MNSSPRSTLHFVLAVVILAGSGGFLAAGKQKGWFIVIKNSLPIRKPLTDMDQKAIAPWKLLSAGKLSAENEGEVGTREYIQWAITDPNGAGERRRPIYISAFYYTGVQDQVPHVGEECLFQGGMTQAAPKEILDWDMPTAHQKVQVGRVMFDDTKQGGVRLLNYYTICVNGEFWGDRNPVRIKMADPRDTHLYYCKVDVSIQTSPLAELAELDAIAKEVLDKGIAELIRAHWPIKGWERGGPPETGKQAT